MEMVVMLISIEVSLDGIVILNPEKTKRKFPISYHYSQNPYFSIGYDILSISNLFLVNLWCASFKEAQSIAPIISWMVGSSLSPTSIRWSDRSLIVGPTPLDSARPFSDKTLSSLPAFPVKCSNAHILEIQWSWGGRAKRARSGSIPS